MPIRKRFQDGHEVMQHYVPGYLPPEKRDPDASSLLGSADEMAARRGSDLARQLVADLIKPTPSRKSR